MKRRQTVPKQWLIVNAEPGAELWQALRRLPRGSGVFLIHQLTAHEMRRLHYLASLYGLSIVVEGPRTAARVHNPRELTKALLRRPPLILVSPLHPTHSHPDWSPLPRMRAATLARLAHRQAVALGGMNCKRYANIAPLGFIAWGGISAFRT